MDEDVKAILNDLYRAINSRLESSRQIEEQVRRLEAKGFHLSLHLEATLLLTRARPSGSGHKRSRRPVRRIRSGSLSLDDRDIQFLKSLKIALDEKREGGADRAATAARAQPRRTRSGEATNAAKTARAKKATKAKSPTKTKKTARGVRPADKRRRTKKDGE